MRPSGGGKLRLTFFGPTRGLIGYQGEFLTDTRGTGVMSRLFHGYALHKGGIEGRRNGVLSRPRAASPSPMRCGTSKTAARCS
jgi:GTP-binding protein